MSLRRKENNVAENVKGSAMQSHQADVEHCGDICRTRGVIAPGDFRFESALCANMLRPPKRRAF
jgi:hypothetical protein